MIRLSVLDQSTVVSGRMPDTSIRESLELARHCEALGYARYWVAEHHNSDSQAGTAPEILISAIAATTQRIRVGSAGVMLPHYSALKVAEQFRVLEAIAPGRIDLGLGRAPGSDGLTAFALNPNASTAADHFPAQVRDVIAWSSGQPLVEGHPFRSVRAQPQGPTVPEVWILGSSDYGAQVAAHFGLPYCFAAFITDGAGAAEALSLYRDDLQAELPPSEAARRRLRLGGGRRKPRKPPSACSPRARCGGWAATAACSCRCPRRRRPRATASPSASAPCRAAEATGDLGHRGAGGRQRCGRWRGSWTWRRSPS